MINNIEVDSNKCIFCGRTADDGVTLIAGAQGVSICNLCVKRAYDILDPPKATETWFSTEASTAR